MAAVVGGQALLERDSALDQKQRTLAGDRGTQPPIDLCESSVSLQKDLPAISSGHAPILRQQKSSVHS